MAACGYSAGWLVHVAFCQLVGACAGHFGWAFGTYSHIFDVQYFTAAKCNGQIAVP